MSEHSIRAEELFRQGYNCAQSVFASFSDITGMELETALRLSSPFGGGMGRLREVCGAVSGMLMVLGAKYGYTAAREQEVKAVLYGRVQTLASRFRDENGSFICRELLTPALCGEGHIPEERTQSYYKKRPCAQYVAYAAQLLDEYISEIEREDIKE